VDNSVYSIVDNVLETFHLSSEIGILEDVFLGSGGEGGATEGKSVEFLNKIGHFNLSIPVTLDQLVYQTNNGKQGALEGGHSTNTCILKNLLSCSTVVVQGASVQKILHTAQDSVLEELPAMKVDGRVDNPRLTRHSGLADFLSCQYSNER